MKIEIDGNEIRIRAKNSSRSLRIHCREDEGKEIISFEISEGPSPMNYSIDWDGPGEADRELAIGDRVELETDNNGPICRGRITKLAQELAWVRWDNSHVTAPIHVNALRPE